MNHKEQQLVVFFIVGLVLTILLVIGELGSLRVNGTAATLDTVLHAGAAILIIPKVEGGR